MSEFYFSAPMADSLFNGAFAIVYVISMLFSLALSLGVYIMTAIGQMKMSQKCGIDKPWLAFIPVANAYNLGLLAEKYDDGKPVSKKYSKILLGLNIATVVGGIVFVVGGIVSMVMGIAFSVAGSVSGSDSEAVMGLGSILIFMLFAFLYMALAIVLAIFTYIALYRVYRIFAPDNAVLFLVLSIFVSIAYPIIMLVLSSKEPVMIRRDYYAPYAGYGTNV